MTQKKKESDVRRVLRLIETSPYKDRIIIATKHCLLLPWKPVARILDQTEKAIMSHHNRSVKRMETRDEKEKKK